MWLSDVRATAVAMALSAVADRRRKGKRVQLEHLWGTRVLTELSVELEGVRGVLALVKCFGGNGVTAAAVLQ